MEEIIELIKNRQETKNCDFKGSFSWQVYDRNQKCEVIKDIIAMANTRDGGRIIIGVEDNTWDIKGLSDEEFASFDVTQINNVLHEYTDPKHSCLIKSLEIYGQKLIVIEVPEFPEDIIITKKGSSCFERGRIYIRTEAAASEVVPSNHEMRELIGRAITKKGDNLLASISTLIKGKPIEKEERGKFTKKEERGNSTEKEGNSNNYDLDIIKAQEHLDRHYKEDFDKYGYYELISYPTNKKDDRIELIKITDLLDKASINLRGKSYPTIKQENNHYLEKGLGSYYKNEYWSYIVRYHFNQSGLILSQETFREDGKNESSPKGSPLLSFFDVIYTITEYIKFLKNFYGIICPDENIMVRIKLHKTNNRLLYNNSPQIIWSDDDERYTSQIDLITYEKIINEVELRSAYQDIITEICQQLFLRFNCNDIHTQNILYYVRDFLKEQN